MDREGTGCGSDLGRARWESVGVSGEFLVVGTEDRGVPMLGEVSKPPSNISAEQGLYDLRSLSEGEISYRE